MEESRSRPVKHTPQVVSPDQISDFPQSRITTVYHNLSSFLLFSIDVPIHVSKLTPVTLHLPITNLASLWPWLQVAKFHLPSSDLQITLGPIQAVNTKDGPSFTSTNIMFLIYHITLSPHGGFMQKALQSKNGRKDLRAEHCNVNIRI